MRIQSAVETLRSDGKLPFYSTSMVTIQYLTGFDGSYAQLLITDDAVHFITDGRYAEYAAEKIPKNVNIYIQQNDGYIPVLKEICASSHIQTLYVEDNVMVHSAYTHLSENIPALKLESAGDCIDRLRMVKHADECEKIRIAAQIGDSCLTHLIQFIRPGMTEWDISVEIENFYRTHGCRKSSFDTIVASGAGSSMPHYIPSMTKKIESDAPLMIDMGCTYEDYNSDLTRTFFIGSVPEEFENIYRVVLDAQMQAIEAVQAGIKTGVIDAAARDIITHAGYGEQFNHSLGHGVGLQVHEMPALRKNGDVELAAGMIVTVEPGIYIPHKGGVRIEDMILVTEDGCEILTRFSKEIIIL